MNEKALLYIPSNEIVGYCTRNPIYWGKPGVKKLSSLNGIGDTAGVTPTPAVEEFLNVLLFKRALFTQKEYADWCFFVWNEWLETKTVEQRNGVMAKLYRNFYPSMIDSLHVWAVLCESGMFDMCFLSSTDDAVGKSDLMVRSGDRVIRIALIGPTDLARSNRNYKEKYRNDGKEKCVPIYMDNKYPMSPGNKRWYQKTDIMKAILGNFGDAEKAA